MNILIIEAYTDGNVGSCALVENAIRILRGRFPGARIRVMAHRPDVFEALYQVEAVRDVFEYPFLQPRIRQIHWFFKTVLWMVFCGAMASLRSPESLSKGNFPFKRKLEPFLWADIAVSVGAERINDKFFKNILFSLYTYSLIGRLGRKLVIFPSTIGPFLFGWSKFLAGRVLGKIDLIYARDELSENITRELVGGAAGTIVRTADIAVAQEWLPREESLGLIQAEEGDLIVGISAMRWSYFRNKVETPFSNYAAYVEEMAKLADSLVSRHCVKIVFYPTNFPVHGCREDDLTTSLEIRDRMTRGEEVRVLEELPTPSELKGMLACSELNFTTRMHACIFSTGSGTPTISINYLFKVREYMRSLGMEEFSIDIEEFNSEWALGAFERMWPERELWRDRITRAIEERKEDLSRAMELVDDLVR